MSLDFWNRVLLQANHNVTALKLSLCIESEKRGECLLTHLGLVACTGHPVLEETEGPADFVFL